MSSQLYSDLLAQSRALTEGEPDLIANLANISALLYEHIEDINWLGFYLTRSDNELVLGPFQGRVACVRIPFGKGVCGVAAETQTCHRVEDVHLFAGHIACDSASNSEVVAPIVVNGKTVAVLDVDSPSVGRFSEEDAKAIQAIADYCQTLNWQGLQS
ncbi:GAF domain-containing protein [Idiomarina loihiensis]|uniref:GAF domain-containing protein n=1 Tax=Idiomarina loihiensis TaxID=135577 RepID=UPI00129CE7CA|nr:GAF domain-containing protein [Idiomarina loihiensis]MRJ43908.1 GAF domain-containing protein [Idiomarina loihiensis]UTW33959.1 GAF domain-containing protein [Idiomarina loihiensis]